MVNIFGDRSDVGAQGSRGATGPRGPQGVQGSGGSRGLQGEQGSSGPAGARGEKGDIGSQGSIGPEGKKGSRGERGPSGFQDMCTWLPSFILNEFRKTESCSYFFPIDGSGFERTKNGGVIKKLITHSTHPALLDHPVNAYCVTF